MLLGLNAYDLELENLRRTKSEDHPEILNIQEMKVQVYQSKSENSNALKLCNELIEQRMKSQGNLNLDFANTVIMQGTSNFYNDNIEKSLK